MFPMKFRVCECLDSSLQGATVEQKKNEVSGFIKHLAVYIDMTNKYKIYNYYFLTYMND